MHLGPLLLSLAGRSRLVCHTNRRLPLKARWQEQDEKSRKFAKQKGRLRTWRLMTVSPQWLLLKLMAQFKVWMFVLIASLIKALQIFISLNHRLAPLGSYTRLQTLQRGALNWQPHRLDNVLWSSGSALFLEACHNQLVPNIIQMQGPLTSCKCFQTRFMKKLSNN